MENGAVREVHNSLVYLHGHRAIKTPSPPRIIQVRQLVHSRPKLPKAALLPQPLWEPHIPEHRMKSCQVTQQTFPLLNRQAVTPAYIVPPVSCTQIPHHDGNRAVVALDAAEALGNDAAGVDELPTEPLIEDALHAIRPELPPMILTVVSDTSVRRWREVLHNEPVVVRACRLDGIYGPIPGPQRLNGRHTRHVAGAVAHLRDQ
mmetsp:Transcript_9199/g.24810  ORF Transcript_9199/g.24810 Transcript_9199/m.24810 type:complete len:204 (-) Transcript_9199:80-691(-)